MRSGQCASFSLSGLLGCTAVALMLSGCSGGLSTSADEFSPVSAQARLHGAHLNTGSLAFPDGFMTSVKTYGAVGDGMTDDTAAIQQALSDTRTDASADYNGKPKALYFPAGTYLVHDTLKWVGCCVTLQGTGPSSSVIRLAPNSTGFTNAASPRAMILTPQGNTSFRQNIWDLGFSVGAGNPGATALNYVTNNVGSVHNVLIKSEDGQGHAGIDLTRQWAGPLMVRNVEIQGFDVAVDLQNSEYGATFEGLTIEHQNVAGIRNVKQPISVRGLVSTNAVPALTNTGGSVVLLDADLSGGVRSANSIQTNSTMYLRNVVSSGYAATLQDTSTGGTGSTKGQIKELVVGASTVFSSAASTASLNLPVEETPSYVSSNVSDWAVFSPRWYGDNAGLQAAFDSGKHTVYFPFGPYFAANEVQITVPDTVRRIIGFSSVYNGSASGTNGGGIRFLVTSNSSQPLVIEQFGYGVKIEHRGSRPVVVKDVRLNGYNSYPGAGKLYLEDVGIQGLVLQSGQEVWARQLDDEVKGIKVTNEGASLWIFGMKTEQSGTVIYTSAKGQTELLGALIYPAVVVPSNQPAFLSTDSLVSYIYRESVYCSGCGYSIQVQETDDTGKTTQINSSPSSPFQVPLYAGFK